MSGMKHNMLVKSLTQREKESLVSEQSEFWKPCRQELVFPLKMSNGNNQGGNVIPYLIPFYIYIYIYINIYSLH